MKYKFLLIMLTVGVSFSLNGMDILRRRRQRPKRQDLILTRVVDPTQPVEGELTKDTPNRDAVDLMGTQKTLQEIQEELELSEEQKKQILDTPVEWFNPTKKRIAGNDPNITWKTIGAIAQEREPISNQIGTYSDHYKNNVRWQWLSRLVLPQLPERLHNQLESLKIPISYQEYVEWKAYTGILHKLDALEELPKIA